MSNTTAKVIVAITTYNLEDYIASALDSVLKQKTDFDYKIIVADDASTDNTVNILKEYRSRFPEKIELLLSEQNQGSLKNSNRIFRNLKSEYFSFLDGDDYWLGETRLQEQVDFMDSHKEYMLCGGNTQYLRNGNLAEYVVPDNKLGKSYTFESYLNGELPFVHTSALLVRNIIFSDGLPECFSEAENTFENCALRGEDFRRLLHLERGPIYILNQTVSVYRIHANGMWQGISSAKRSIETAIGYHYYSKYFGTKYGSFFSDKASAAYRTMMINLATDNHLLGHYELNENETYLLTSLLNDLAGSDKKIPSNNSPFASKCLKLFCRVFLAR